MAIAVINEHFLDGSNPNNIALNFDASLAYQANKYCLYNGQLYKFVQNKPAGEWDSSKVIACIVTDEMGQGGSGADTTLIADNYSTTQDYTINDYCVYENELYRFIENKSAGEWDSSKVLKVSVCTELKSLVDATENKMNINNPRGTGSFAMNISTDSELGRAATALGGNASSLWIEGYMNGYISFVSYDSVLDETIYTINNKSDISDLLLYLDKGLYIVFDSYDQGDIISIDTSTKRITVKGQHSGYTRFNYLRYYRIDANTASGNGSLAEGGSTTASGECSHSEGRGTTASGYSSHAEGDTTEASAYYSHAEGYVTTASGQCSHAEGDHTTASGYGSHSEGSATIAAGQYQHVEGQYNVEDTENKYAHIIGNGDYQNRSNAYTVDWSGNGEYAGDVVANKGKTNEVSLSQINTDLTSLSNFVPHFLFKDSVNGTRKVSVGLGVLLICGQGANASAKYVSFLVGYANGASGRTTITTVVDGKAMTVTVSETSDEITIDTITPMYVTILKLV